MKAANPSIVILAKQALQLLRDQEDVQEAVSDVLPIKEIANPDCSGVTAPVGQSIEASRTSSLTRQLDITEFPGEIAHCMLYIKKMACLLTSLWVTSPQGTTITLNRVKDSWYPKYQHNRVLLGLFK